MIKEISRRESARSQVSSVNDHAEDAMSRFMKKFDCMRCVNDVVENMVNDISAGLHDVDANQALEGGILTCLLTAKDGSRIEINAIDLERLASEKVSDSDLKQRVEARMSRQADKTISAIEADALESMLDSACEAASEDGRYLAVHEVEDLSFFTVISPSNGASGQTR